MPSAPARKLAGGLFAAMVAAASGVPALADAIPVPNGSFESPALPVAPPFAANVIDNWQRAPVPAWWLLAGYTSEDWDNSGGIFVNVDPTFNTPIDNADGNQIAFLFSPPGNAIFQDLTATYQPGQSYHLVVGVEGGGYGMLLGVPLQISLYYRDDLDNQVTIDSVLAPNTNATGDQTHLTDFQLDLPAVGLADPWAGRNIGIMLASGADFNNAGGFWVMDNVRLTEVPEPTALALLALVPVALLRRRRVA